MGNSESGLSSEVVKQGNLAQIKKYLSSSKSNVNITDETGMTMLHIACKHNQHSIAQYLLEKKADPKIKDRDQGQIPLHIASEKGHHKLVRLLIFYRSDVNAKDKKGRTPLGLATKFEHRRTVRTLIENRANVNLAKFNLATPLLAATEIDNLEIVWLLLEANADVNAVSRKGTTPLYVACKQGNLAMVELYISKGANLETKFNGSITPLMVSCEHNHFNIVKVLVQSGADINVSDHKNNTALHIATEKFNLDIVTYLLSQKAAILKNRYGETPLTIAKSYGETDIVSAFEAHLKEMLPDVTHKELDIDSNSSEDDSIHFDSDKPEAIAGIKHVHIDSSSSSSEDDLSASSCNKHYKEADGDNDKTDTGSDNDSSEDDSSDNIHTAFGTYESQNKQDVNDGSWVAFSEESWRNPPKNDFGYNVFENSTCERTEIASRGEGSWVAFEDESWNKNKAKTFGNHAAKGPEQKPCMEAKHRTWESQKEPFGYTDFLSPTKQVYSGDDLKNARASPKRDFELPKTDHYRNWVMFEDEIRQPHEKDAVEAGGLTKWYDRDRENFGNRDYKTPGGGLFENKHIHEEIAVKRPLKDHSGHGGVQNQPYVDLAVNNFQRNPHGGGFIKASPIDAPRAGAVIRAQKDTLEDGFFEISRREMHAEGALKRPQGDPHESRAVKTPQKDPRRNAAATLLGYKSVSNSEKEALRSAAVEQCPKPNSEDKLVKVLQKETSEDRFRRIPVKDIPIERTQLYPTRTDTTEGEPKEEPQKKGFCEPAHKELEDPQKKRFCEPAHKALDDQEKLDVENPDKEAEAGKYPHKELFDEKITKNPHAENIKHGDLKETKDMNVHESKDIDDNIHVDATAEHDGDLSINKNSSENIDKKNDKRLITGSLITKDVQDLHGQLKPFIDKIHIEPGADTATDIDLKEVWTKINNLKTDTTKSASRLDPEKDCSDKHLLKIALKLGQDWKILGGLLGVGYQQIQDLDKQFGLDIRNAAWSMLIEWRQKHSEDTEDRREVLKQATDQIDRKDLWDVI